jgi:hypothetical protein
LEKIRLLAKCQFDGGIMKFTLAINQTCSMEIAYSELADFIGFFNDNRSSSDFYDALSEHPASRIRAEVATKTCLPITTLERLSEDASLEVVQKVASNQAAMKAFRFEVVQKMIRRDVSIALEVARYQMPYLNEWVRELVEEELLEHRDPDVREALKIED